MGSRASGGFEVSARLPLQPPGIPHHEVLIADACSVPMRVRGDVLAGMCG